MPSLVRFGVSLDKDLSLKFDQHIKKNNYTNRSEAIRDLIRAELVQKEWEENKEVAGAITLLYDHHKRELVNKLTDIQHDYGDIIMSSQHMHLDYNNCLEIIAIKGSPRQAEILANTLKAVKGVKHGTLSMSTTGRNI